MPAPRARSRLLAAALSLLPVLAALPARAQEAVAVRYGLHPNFGRVVLEWTSPVAIQASQSGAVFTLRFARDGTPSATALRQRPPRNIQRISTASEGGVLVVRLELAPGVRARAFTLDKRVVVDAHDASPAEAAAARAAAPAPAREVPAAAASAAPAAAAPETRPAAPPTGPAPPTAAVAPAPAEAAPAAGSPRAGEETPVATPPLAPSPAARTGVPEVPPAPVAGASSGGAAAPPPAQAAPPPAAVPVAPAPGPRSPAPETREAALPAPPAPSPPPASAMPAEGGRTASGSPRDGAPLQPGTAPAPLAGAAVADAAGPPATAPIAIAALPLPPRREGPSVRLHAEASDAAPVPAIAAGAPVALPATGGAAAPAAPPAPAPSARSSSAAALATASAAQQRAGLAAASPPLPTAPALPAAPAPTVPAAPPQAEPAAAAALAPTAARAPAAPAAASPPAEVAAASASTLPLPPLPPWARVAASAPTQQPAQPVAAASAPAAASEPQAPVAAARDPATAALVAAIIASAATPSAAGRRAPPPSAPAPQASTAAPPPPASPAAAATPEPAAPAAVVPPAAPSVAPAVVALAPPAADIRPPAATAPSLLSRAGPRGGPGAVALETSPDGGPRLVIPAPAEVAAAALRRGSSAWLVFDHPLRLDLAALGANPQLAQAESGTTPAGTFLRLPAAAARRMVLRRVGEAWVADLAAPPSPPERPIATEIADEADGARLLFHAEEPGGVVPIRDHETGALVLVGTVRRAGQSMPVERRFAEFVLLPTLQGVAVQPLADSIVLRSDAQGFSLTAGLRRSGGLQVGGPVAADALAEAAQLSRLLYLPTFDPPALAARARRLAAIVADAPPLARTGPRLDLAETLLAQGLGIETGSLVELAATDDPDVASSSRGLALGGLAALLAGRLEEAERALADAKLGESDETTLLRGLLASARGEPPADTEGFVAALPLLFAYPEALRHRLGALAADGLLAADEHAAAGRLVQRLGELEATAPGAALIAYARARVAEAQGDTDAARQGYEVLINGRDRLARVRAALSAVDLDLRERRIGPAEAAERLEPFLHAWRGDAIELRLRLRLASLRAAAGDPRGALVLWRSTSELFPEDTEAAGVEAKMHETYLEAFRRGTADAMPAAQLISMFDENLDLLPAGSEGNAIVRKVAERAAQAELASRAAALLRTRIAGLPGGLERARLGLVLAEMRLSERDAPGARQALADTEAPDLPAPLALDRLLASARALALAGDRAGATALLERHSEPRALAVRADIAWTARDWPAAQAALSALLAATLRPGAPADAAARRTLVRLAATAALTGDAARLAALRRDYGASIAEGPLSEPFRLLTADPVSGLADLPRIAAEIDIARALPDSLAAADAAAAGSASPRN